jgi:hypothetical protein
MSYLKHHLKRRRLVVILADREAAFKMVVSEAVNRISNPLETRRSQELSSSI